MGFTTFENGWWFNHNTKKWEQNPNAGEKGYSSHQDCRTVKAFRRKLKSAPMGVEFILISRWVGYNVTGFGCAQRQSIKAMIEELTSYDRTTALHSINLTDTLIKIKDKEFMKYYEKFKDAN